MNYPGVEILELTKEQKYIILALIGILVSGLAYAVYNNFTKASSAEIVITDTEELEPKKMFQPELVVVHISGAVKNRGVYKLEKGARLIDLIKVAGGILENANPDKVNLAEELKDGQRISIPFKPAQKEFCLPKSAPLEETSGNISTGPVNINTASAGELMKVKGVGEATAKRIIEYRDKNGGFSKPEDIMKVKGIGKGKFGKIKGQISVY